MLSLDAGEVFTAGDHYNDISMLDPYIAAHLACPCNAITHVREIVSGAGGFISSRPAGLGVAEALTCALKKMPAPYIQTVAGNENP